MTALIFKANNCVCYLGLKEIIIQEREGKARYLTIYLADLPDYCRSLTCNNANDVKRRYSEIGDMLWIALPLPTYLSY